MVSLYGVGMLQNGLLLGVMFRDVPVSIVMGNYYDDNSHCFD